MPHSVQCGVQSSHSYESVFVVGSPHSAQLIVSTSVCVVVNVFFLSVFGRGDIVDKGDALNDRSHWSRAIVDAIWEHLRL